MSTIAGHVIHEQIGAGGMAVVLRATHLGLERDVALKCLHPSCALDAELLERFRREIRVVASLDHPHIVAIYASGEHEGSPWFTMELMTAPTLRDVQLEQPRLPLRDALRILIDVLDGLSAVHAARIVHRDVKPTNIFVHPERGALLADFGLAKPLDRTQMTAQGETLGTAAYMAPEQALGLEVTPALDLYACGVILFELLAGTRPFENAENPIALMQAHVTAEPPRLASIVPGTPREISDLVHRMLAKSAEDRPPGAALLRDQLRAHLHDLDHERPPRRAPAPPAARTSPRRVLLGAAVLLAGAACAALIALHRPAIRPPPVPAGPHSTSVPAEREPEHAPARLTASPTFTPTETIPIPLPHPPAFFLGGDDFFDPVFIGKRRKVETSFYVRFASSIAQAELALGIERFPAPMFFEIRLGHARLTVPARRGVDPRGPHPYHLQIDPALLREGANPLFLALRIEKQATSLETPWLGSLSLRLRRR